VQTATSSTGNFVPASSSGAILYGSQNTSPTVTAYVYIACTWIRLLDASEFFEFYNDPYGVLIYQDDYAFASFAAVVSAPAFTAVNRRTLGPRVGSRSVY
jgi:hypothetical protein